MRRELATLLVGLSLVTCTTACGGSSGSTGATTVPATGVPGGGCPFDASMAGALGLGVQLAAPFVNDNGLGTCEYRNNRSIASVTFTDVKSPWLDSVPGKTASAFVSGLRATYSRTTVPSGLGPDAWEDWEPASSGTADDTIAWTKGGQAFVLQVNVRNGSELHRDRVQAAARKAFNALP